jgi:hypothetical protein
VAVGRPTLRSVDSEREGRVIEPRKDRTEEASVFKTSAGSTRALNGLAHRARPGSESTAGTYGGLPRNLGDPIVPAETMPGGPPANKGPGSRCADAGQRESERRASTAVLLSEGNEARWEGRWGVGAP